MTAPGEGAGRDNILREVLKLQGLIRAVLRRYGVPDADLPDCTQDVLIVAYRHVQAGRFNPPDPSLPLAENVAAWLGGIAQWTAIEASRTRARRGRVFSTQSKEWRVDVDALRVPSPEARVEAKDELAIFDRARLSPKQLEVVELAAQGYTAREIGELLGHPRGHRSDAAEACAVGVGEGAGEALDGDRQQARQPGIAVEPRQSTTDPRAC